VRTNYSATTGLMPDFVVGSNPAPAPANFLESPYDGAYNYNACRVPLRIVMDYGHYGNTNAKTSVNKMVNWIKTKTSSNPSAIRAGFYLNGTNLPGNNYQDAVFISPFVAASVCDASHQAFLNSGWSLILGLKENYFSDTYNLLNLLFITGNWWIPTDIVLSLEKPVIQNNDFEENLMVRLFPNPFTEEVSLILEEQTAFINYELYNSTGTLVKSDAISSIGQPLNLNLSGFPKGYYLLVVKTENKIKTFKLIKSS
jgi:hypothetical protein